MRLANSDFAYLASFFGWRKRKLDRKEQRFQIIRKEESKNKNGTEKVKRNHSPTSGFQPLPVDSLRSCPIKTELMHFELYIAVQIGPIA